VTRKSDDRQQSLPERDRPRSAGDHLSPFPASESRRAKAPGLRHRVAGWVHSARRSAHVGVCGELAVRSRVGVGKQYRRAIDACRYARQRTRAAVLDKRVTITRYHVVGRCHPSLGAPRNRGSSARPDWVSHITERSPSAGPHRVSSAGDG
jgi:hypothetical protein